MYTITREIGIDMGHRVTTHGSKCKNVHGHRYTIQATCSAGFLFKEGEQTDMVLDFGFLKEEMMRQIDQDFDHGFCIYRHDNLLSSFLEPQNESFESLLARIDKRRGIGIHCVLQEPTSIIGKLVIVPFIPTAEKLAEHWFRLLEKRVEVRSVNNAILQSVKVWETPNCSAVFERPSAWPAIIS